MYFLDSNLLCSDMERDPDVIVSVFNWNQAVVGVNIWKHFEFGQELNDPLKSLGELNA